jgi:hypothetical protein
MGRIAQAFIRRIEPKADAWFAKHGDNITDMVRDWVGAAPKFNAAERDLDREHAAFLGVAKLNTTYWSPNGGWVWLWTEHMEHPELVAFGRYRFTRRTRTHLVDAELNVTSREAIREAWPNRLMTCEPMPVPPKPTQPDPDSPFQLKL